MNASTQWKLWLAATATAGFTAAALAQSTPPTSGTANPAIGAGQQSSQATPMGTTGTQPATGAAASDTAAGSTAAPAAGGSTMGAGGTAGSDTMPATDATRPARADRG